MAELIVASKSFASRLLRLIQAKKRSTTHHLSGNDKADLIRLLLDNFDEDVRSFCHALMVVPAVDADVLKGNKRRET